MSPSFTESAIETRNRVMIGDVFPVLYSTLTCEALTARVLRHYDIGLIQCCQFWNRGLSDVYLVDTTTGPYVLRVSHHHWRSRTDIEFELELLDFFHQHHLPVAYPLKTRNGQLCIELNAPEGARYAALFTYAPGRVALGDLNPAQAHKLGETVARLHQVSANFRSDRDRQPLTLEYLLDDSLGTIAPFLQHRPQEISYLADAIAQIKEQLADFPNIPPLWSICWGDPHSGNAHFTTDDQLTLFDFDQCGYGWRAFDIGKFFQVALHAGVRKNTRDAFLTGYQTVEPLQEIELNALQMFTQTAHIWTWAISLCATRLHSYSRLDDSYFNARIERLKMLRSPEWGLF